MPEITGNYSTIDNPISLDDLPDDTLVSMRVDTLRCSLEYLMKLVALRGFSCFVKCDAERNENIFTVMVGNYQRADTDNPREYIMDMLGIKGE